MNIQKSFTGIFMLIFSLPFLGIGGKFGVEAYTIRTEGILTEGKVIAMRSNNEGSYAPTISFTTLAGETVVYEHNTYSSPPAYSTGDKAELYYLAASPTEDVYVVSILSWLFPLLFFSAGFLIFCLGAFQIMKAAKGKEVTVRTIDTNHVPTIDDDPDIETPESFIQRND